VETASSAGTCRRVLQRFGQPEEAPTASFGADAVCRVGTTDADGHFTVGATVTDYGLTDWILFGADGSSVGQFEGLTSALWGTPTGFLGVTHASGGGPVGVGLLAYDWNSQQKTRMSVGVDGLWQSTPTVVQDPEDGTTSAFWEGLSTLEDTRLYLRRTDAQGATRPGFPIHIATTLRCRVPSDAVAAATSVAGNSLVLWHGESWFGAGSTAGQWFGPDGLPLSDVFDAHVPLATARYFSEAPNRLQALASGGLALRVDGQWAYFFADGSTSAAPAPCWLQRRPDTRLVLRGGMQLLIPEAVDPRPCDSAVNLFTDEGDWCGALQVGNAADVCNVLSVSVGRDGTLVHLESPEWMPNRAGYGGQVTCHNQLWPGLLGDANTGETGGN
jgi:hypothetical protein